MTENPFEKSPAAGCGQVPFSSSGPDVTRDLLLRYDKPGPRYTSYPTVPEWGPEFGEPEYREALVRASARSDDPLSIYIHIPFCRKRCAYCGCNAIAARDPVTADKYIEHVLREMRMAAGLLGGRRGVRQLHWGGGTPTHLTVAQCERLFGGISDCFDLMADAEIAIEADPRVTTQEHVLALRALGFNRISMGVQDLDPEVQRLIGRSQTETQTRELFTRCRGAGFQGINMDLVYGLPGQTPETWARTIEKVIEIRPDRLAVYSFAYLPAKLRNQKRVDAARLPTPPQKYELLVAARRALIAAGYCPIGMDHFALPEDELAVAMGERRLHRNFMGYTVIAAPDQLGFGASAISDVSDAYAQNDKRLAAYYHAISQDRFATACGRRLSEDDRIRRWVIRQLMCNFYLDTAEFSRRFGVCFEDYFRDERPALEAFASDGFLKFDNGNLCILPLGQVFVRNVAMAFDAYLRKSQTKAQFSRTV